MTTSEDKASFQGCLLGFVLCLLIFFGLPWVWRQVPEKKETFHRINNIEKFEKDISIKIYWQDPNTKEQCWYKIHSYPRIFLDLPEGSPTYATWKSSNAIFDPDTYDFEIHASPNGVKP